ncbi:type VI secretion system tube protein TssD [Porphyromonas gingivalis]|uniref:type VI secretion system tube protein TssD n=1 Tax=Porphyromonas gingivalis TaxID=837 RepID=UPI000974F860|nr:type VI secretion system tube protein TssD [Porphyromonas gingivalis]ATR92406.1 hypothetical protein CS545_04500 [Porphyromonas gingivalis]ATS07600.1 hypothetical protein CS388_00080 [Porphyromonas gingivalis]SJL21910.1 hypothetical protein PGIN_3A1_01379 [Porphyromonas gingivalis]
MAANKTILLLSNEKDYNSETVFGEPYDLIHSKIEAHQRIDNKGKAQSEPYGGIITVVLDRLPSDEIIEWGMNPRRYKSGSLVMELSLMGTTAQKIIFSNAACTSIKVRYTRHGEAYAQTRLEIKAESIIVGDFSLDNAWTKY